jgi:tetratricopeptide (TPR) repeat protein
MEASPLPGGGLRRALPVLLAAVAARALFFAGLARSPLFDFFRNDQLYYREWGLRIASGELLGRGVFEQGPLYAYLLGGLYRVLGPRDHLVMLLQAGCGVLTAALVHACARRLWDGRSALLAGLLAALYGPLLFAEGMIMKTFLEPLLALAAIAAGLRGLASGRARWFAAAGAAVGLAALVREVHLLLLAPLLLAALLPPGAGAAGARRRTLTAAAALLAFLGVLAPSALRNWAVGGEPVAVSSAGGQNLYVAFGPYANGTYVSPPFVRSLAYQEHEDFREEAFLRTGRRMTRGETSRYWLGEALRWAGARPGATLRLEGRKVAILFNDYEVPDNEDYEAARGYVPLLRLLPGFGWIGGLGLLGLALALRRRGPALLAAGFALALLLEVLLTFNLGRYRAAFAAVWILLAGGGLGWVASAGFWRRSPGLPARLGLAAAAIVVTVLAFRPGCADDPSCDAAVHERFRRSAEESARHLRTIPSLERESAARPRDPRPLTALGDACAATGRLTESLRAYEAALAVDQTALEPRLALADLAAKMGEPGRAEAHARVLLAFHPGHAGAWTILGDVLVRRAEHARGDEEARPLLGEAVTAYRQALATAPAQVQARLGLGKALLILGDRAGALAELERARDLATAAGLAPEHRRASHLIRLVGARR